MKTILAIALSTLFLPIAKGFAADAPRTFTYQGKVFRANGSTPLEAPSVAFKVQLRSADGLCLLFEETHLRDMTDTGGLFTLNIGEGTNSGVSGLSLSQVFDNSTAKTGASGCSYTPSSGDTRRLRFSYDDGVENVQLPVDQTLRSVPYAFYAMSLQGLTKDKIIQTSSTTTQLNVDQLTAQTSALLALVNGLPLSSGTLNMSAGGLLVNDTPASSASAINKAYADSHFGGQAMDLSGLANGQTLVWNSTTNKFEAALPSINSGTIGGSTVVNVSGNITTSGNVSATNMSATAGSLKTLRLFESTNTKRVTISSPAALGADYNLVLPINAGSSNQVLSTDGAGNLSWMSVGTPSGSATGDLSGSYPSPAVAKLQGVTVSAAAPVSSQIMRYNGSAWAAAYGNSSDMKTSLGVSQFPTNCTASQTMVYSSVTDTFSCVSIALNGSAVANIDWSKITSGKPTTLAGYGVTDGMLSADFTFANMGSKPTTLVGYGITDAVKTSDLGTSANKVVQLDASAKLPAVDGSQVTNISYSNISGKPTTAAGYGITDVMLSANFTYGNLGGKPTTVSGYGITDAVKTGDLGTAANKVVQMTAAAKLPAVDGSLLTNLAWSNVSGTPTTVAGYGITDAVKTSDVGTGANKIVKTDANGKLPAMDASNLTGLPIPFSRMQVFDSSGTFSVPANITTVFVQVWGAGGGGGAGLLVFGGGGGASGGYGASMVTVTGGTDISVVVGTAGQPVNNAAGTAGTASSFSGVVANGGAGGPINTSQIPALGGSATAQQGVTGARGGVGLLLTAVTVGGTGGSAPNGGAGGPGAYGGVAGIAGNTPGGGGGGGGGTLLGSVLGAGAAGGGGRVVVWY